MRIIKTEPDQSGAYPGPQSWGDLSGGLLDVSTIPDGYAWLPDELDLTEFFRHKGFVTLVIEDGTVTAITPNQEAYDAWMAEHPEPDPLETLRASKEAEISAACNAAIVAGMDVETLQGTEHFALQETDQINLTTAYNAILAGATGYPYHADGELCRMFTAEEITAISMASISHKLYHTTLCNHLLTWARRAATELELESITYTADDLPEDLAATMASVLAATAAMNV